MVKTEVRWIVRVYTAYELVHIKSRCIENWAAPGVEVVTLTDHKQALAEKDMEIQTLELQQAKAALNEEAAKVLLASCKEKDREIERLHRREQSLLERIKAAKDVKDREIQQIREHEFQRGYQEREAAYQQLMVQRDKLAEDLATTKAWKDDWKLEVMAHHKTQDEYNTLMEQAVRFARYIKDEFTYDDDPRFVEAEAFLKEREVTT